ncbi:uncharacterized protein BT62DRAFT_1001314 [Guyanagaster necrorhizus]|uniref:Anaphase-promoting complex subunit 4 n=1 Tax=Guyanagaster necrorhizus TaxID=856835 RepID=A0A9P7W0S4_9AGAR|nr:uncharacterized protein BT62DRAFT_1001314 [Guyanagaster necrorhizus MCA 3950]KAG7450497.1 hypothetical protein BT62DRAFT_1001314 [Guyanagaster necrorhizus MCA 3950]
MQTNAFASLSLAHLSSPCRLLASACCPDKDLVLLVTQVGLSEGLNLYKNNGIKVWEVDPSDNIIDVAWSPDGRSIAVTHAHYLKIHSLQDGRVEGILSIRPSGGPMSISSVWWHSQEKPVRNSSIPDIFQRDDIVTGSARSLLQALPLLDNIQDDTPKASAIDLFAFQGSQTGVGSQTDIPKVIKAWPTLKLDLMSASMGSANPVLHADSAGGEVADDADDANVNSILVAVDGTGRMHCFLDGSYPLGAANVGGSLSISSLYKHPKRPTFYAYPCQTSPLLTSTALEAVTIDVPLLQQRQVRDMAKLSSIVRQLSWYIMRIVKEMYVSWFGSDTVQAARDMGPKWIQGLKARRQVFVVSDYDPILDITTLLLTGRASDQLADYLGSNGESMSERASCAAIGLHRWEGTVVESLMMLRDFSEKRLAPACQRIHLVLEEVQGWSKLPEYALFELQSDDLATCIEHCNRAIILAAWLAAAARREFTRFREFMSWLRFEILSANPNNDVLSPVIRHDILEVNKYFMSGLVVSPIDKWFMGPVPHFSPRDLGINNGSDSSLSDVLKRTQDLLDNTKQMAWRPNVKQRNLNHIDRNIVSLIQELVSQCQRVFLRAAGATGRSARITVGAKAFDERVVNTRANLKIRERTSIEDNNGNAHLLQYLVIPSLSAEGPTFLCLARVEYGSEKAPDGVVEVCLLECCIENEDGSKEELEVLEAEFFDDEYVVIVYRLRGEDGGTFIATVGYNDLGYQGLLCDGEYVRMHLRENLMDDVVSRWRTGQMESVRIPIKRCRRLAGCQAGEVALAVNGRKGRRVACVIGGNRMMMEVIDLEGEDAEGEENAEISMADE